MQRIVRMVNHLYSYECGRRRECLQNKTHIAIIASEKPLFSKPTFSSPVKRRHDLFEDDPDTENIAPTTPFSTQKRSKAADGSALKPSRFVLTDATPLEKKAPSSAPAPRVPGLLSPVGQNRKFSVTSPQKGSISSSRGSPKHKRVGLLSKRSRASGSPFRRIDPPSFGKTPGQSGALPFSIDAALSGTISSYTPKNSTSKSTSTTRNASSSSVKERSMPEGWFFAIHEDSPEEETANIMAHNTGVLDISSDDDCITKRRKEERDCEKENIPPPDHRVASTSTPAHNNARTESLSIETDAKVTKSSDVPVFPSQSKASTDKEDLMIDVLAARSPLGDLRAADYYPDGLDGSSIHVFTETSVTECSVTQATASDKDVSADEQNFLTANENDALCNVKASEACLVTGEENVAQGANDIAVYDEGNVCAAAASVSDVTAQSVSTAEPAEQTVSI